MSARARSRSEKRTHLVLTDKTPIHNNLWIICIKTLSNSSDLFERGSIESAGIHRAHIDRREISSSLLHLLHTRHHERRGNREHATKRNMHHHGQQTYNFKHFFFGFNVGFSFCFFRFLICSSTYDTDCILSYYCILYSIIVYCKMSQLYTAFISNMSI